MSGGSKQQYSRYFGINSTHLSKNGKEPFFVDVDNKSLLQEDIYSTVSHLTDYQIVKYTVLYIYKNGNDYKCKTYVCKYGV